MGHGARALIARGCERPGDPVDPRAIETLYQEFVIYYAANISAHSRPFPGLLPFLDRCQAKGLAMAVCTNKLEDLSHRLLKALGMDAYFGAVVGPDTIGVAKPDPRPYFEACARLGRDPALSIMVVTARPTSARGRTPRCR